MQSRLMITIFIIAVKIHLSRCLSLMNGTVAEELAGHVIHARTRSERHKILFEFAHSAFEPSLRPDNFDQYTRHNGRL